MMTPEQKRVAVLDYKRRYRARHRNAQTIGTCACGEKASTWSSGGYVCDTCRRIEAQAMQHDLRHDRDKVRQKKKPNPEYLQRYSAAYYQYRHLPKEERCERARLVAAMPLVVVEEQKVQQKCECGYPAIEGETQCSVCKYVLCHSKT